MRRAPRTDGNQPEIVAALRKAGWTVMIISGAGENRPDLIIAKAGETWALEIKNPRGYNRVSKGQAEWQATWEGKCAVVRSAEEAIAIVSRRAT